MIKSILVKNRDTMHDTLREAHEQRNMVNSTLLHIYTQTHRHTYLHTFIDIYTHIHTYTLIHLFIYIYIQD